MRGVTAVEQDDIAWALAWMGDDAEPAPKLEPLHEDEIRWTLRSVDVSDELLAHQTPDQIAPAAVADVLARRELLAVALDTIARQQKQIARHRELRTLERRPR